MRCKEGRYHRKLTQYLELVPVEVFEEFSRKIEDKAHKRKQCRPYFRDQLMTNNDFFFQEDEVIQDRFIVHEKHYRALREGLAKTVISGNIQDIATVITVCI